MASIEEYKKRIQEFISCLVRKDYQAVNNIMLANSVPIQDIRRVIEEYGCTIYHYLQKRLIWHCPIKFPINR